MITPTLYDKVNSLWIWTAPDGSTFICNAPDVDTATSTVQDQINTNVQMGLASDVVAALATDATAPPTEAQVLAVALVQAGVLTADQVTTALPAASTALGIAQLSPAQVPPIA